MTAALIIAAGATTVPDSFEPLKLVGSISAVQRQIAVFQKAGVDRVVVVGGTHFDQLEGHVAHMGVICLHNQHAGSTEMLDSIKMGLAYLAGKCSRVLVTPVDVPLFTVETVQRLAATTEKVALPVHGGQTGHPIFLSAKVFPLVQQYQGPGGLWGCITASGLAVQRLAVPDEGVLADVGRGEEFEHLVRRHNLARLHPEVKVYLSKEQTFFGPDTYLLLSLINETDSLREACGQMGISYSKGWKMVNHMEQQMGCKLVHRKRGGSEKGRSDITAAGRDLLEKYRRLTQDANRQVQVAFARYFHEET